MGVPARSAAENGGKAAEGCQAINSTGVYALNGFSEAWKRISAADVFTTIVGLPDSAVREATDRVRSALKTLSFVWPVSRITAVIRSPAISARLAPCATCLFFLPFWLPRRSCPSPARGRRHQRAFAGRRRAQCDGRVAWYGAGRGAAGRAPPVRFRRNAAGGRNPAGALCATLSIRRWTQCAI